MLQAEVYLDGQLLFTRVYEAHNASVDEIIERVRTYVIAEGFGEAGEECHLHLIPLSAREVS